MPSKIKVDLAAQTATVGERTYKLEPITYDEVRLGYKITLPTTPPEFGADAWWHYDGNFGGSFEAVDDMIAIRKEVSRLEKE